MWRPDELVIEMKCGARLMIHLAVDPAECRERDGLCPTADQLAAELWAQVHLGELELAAAKRTDQPKGELNA
jgi:hypothetical protein